MDTLANLAAPTRLLRRKWTMRPHSLDKCVCTVGDMALARQVSICPREPLGMESRMKSPREKPSCEGLDLDCFQVPTPTPSRDQRPRCTFCLWVPYCLSNHFLLFTYFDLTQSQWISLPVTKQFITKTNGWNLSHLKNNPAIGRIDSPRARTAVKCRILCGLRKCFSINYPTLDEKNMVSHLNNWLFLKQMSTILFQIWPNNGICSKWVKIQWFANKVLMVDFNKSQQIPLWCSVIKSS